VHTLASIRAKHTPPPLDKSVQEELLIATEQAAKVSIDFSLLEVQDVLAIKSSGRSPRCSRLSAFELKKT
jgi:hypothetical protein